MKSSVEMFRMNNNIRVLQIPRRIAGKRLYFLTRKRPNVSIGIFLIDAFFKSYERTMETIQST